jgi:hypothetical protein
MVRFFVSLRAFVCLCALISPMVFAKSVNLKTIQVSLPTDYGVLLTEVHFDERDLDVALKVKKIISNDLIKVINYFHYVPRSIVHINIDPYMRLTNGNAVVFPTDIINLYNFPASNSDHLIVMEDWLRGLLFHEFTHITHLDQTSGYLEVGRQIFGSFAKIPAGIVPRWFTEGIAVWSESHLLGAGRLSNPLFRKELLVQFLRKEYCSSIDCLDEPGVYPQGQLAYWAGAHFMEYIENKKAGSIKCFVENNSNNVPFFLNVVFRQCVGMEAQPLFAEFRKSFIDNQPAVTPESEAWGDKISNAFGSDDLQKGIVLDDNVLFKVEHEREREALVSYDLQENVNMMVAQYRYPISDIVGVTTVPSIDNEQSDGGKCLIVAFNEDFRYREKNRVWKLINTETLLIEATIPLNHDPSYVIGLGNNRFLTASFIDNKWLIEKQRVDLNADKVIDSEVIQQFATETNLSYFKKEGQNIFIKLNRGDAGTTLYVSDLGLGKFYKLYESKDFFDIPINTEKFLVVREREQKKLIEIGDNYKNISVSNVDKSLLARVTSVEITDKRVLVLENRLKTKEMTSKEALTFLKKKTGSTVVTPMSAVTFSETTKPEAENYPPMENFPTFYHLLPHYWFLATGTSENLGSIGATTTLVDPMALNTIQATALVYPSVSKIGGSIDAVHKFAGVSDLWSASLYLNREYTKTDFNDSLDETTEGTVGTQYAFLMKRWTWIPGLYIGTTREQDFISDRKITNTGIGSYLTYMAYSFDDYFQSLTLQTKFQNDHTDTGHSFIDTQSKLSLLGRFHERLTGGIKASYGKLVKSGFKDGVIYAGGTGSYVNTRWHEFYGLPYSNAYGNEIFTFRGYVDWNFWYIYRGESFIPVFLKEAHLILGREMLSADVIFLGGKVYRNETIHSFFAGPKIKTNLFYYVPADLDLIFSSIQRPSGGGSVNQVEFNVSADF